MSIAVMRDEAKERPEARAWLQRPGLDREAAMPAADVPLGWARIHPSSQAMPCGMPGRGALQWHPQIALTRSWWPRRLRSCLELPMPAGRRRARYGAGRRGVYITLPVPDSLLCLALRNRCPIPTFRWRRRRLTGAGGRHIAMVTGSSAKFPASARFPSPSRRSIPGRRPRRLRGGAWEVGDGRAAPLGPAGMLRLPAGVHGEGCPSRVTQ